MKKYVNPRVLLAMCREDIELFGQPDNAMEWISRIADECPPSENIMHVPFAPGTIVWTPDGRTGMVESLYIGQRGVQRIFVRLIDGSKLNCSAKGIGKDILRKPPSDPEISRSEPSDDE